MQRSISTHRPSPAGGRFRRPLSLALLVVVPVLTVVVALVIGGIQDSIGWDLRMAFLPAADDVLHGRSPYPGLESWALHHEAAYVYPPFVAFLVTPLTLVPPALATVIVILALALAVLLLLRLCGVTDPRVFGVACLWPAVWDGFQIATVSLGLALLVAVAWRLRDRDGRAPAAAIGVAVGAKLFLAPLWLWLLATGRRSAAAWTVPIGVAVVGIPWAAIGFAGFTGYPRLLGRLTELEQGDSYSVVSVAIQAGLPVAAARIVAVTVALILCLTAFRAARRGRDLQSLTLFLLSALAFSPIVWHHYFAVLLVPLALVRPTLGPAWLLPLLSWPGPYSFFLPARLEGLTLIGWTLLAVFLVKATGQREAVPVSEPAPPVSGPLALEPVA